MMCCKEISISVEAAPMICTSGSGPIPDFYTGSPPVPTQPDPVYFNELSAIETLLSGSIYDDADPGDPVMGAIPLFDTGNSNRKVRYLGSPTISYRSVGGKRVAVDLFMYYQSPLSGAFNPTWWFYMYCFSSGAFVDLFGSYKAVGDEQVGTYVYVPGSFLYSGSLTICKPA